MCVCVCVFFPSILDIKFVGRTSRGHTGGRSHMIFNPPSFCGACLDFCREKDSAIPFPRRPWSRILCTNELIVLHPLGIFILVLKFLVRKIPFAGIELTSQRVRRLRGANWATGVDRLQCTSSSAAAVAYLSLPLSLSLCLCSGVPHTISPFLYLPFYFFAATTKCLYKQHLLPTSLLASIFCDVTTGLILCTPLYATSWHFLPGDAQKV